MCRCESGERYGCGCIVCEVCEDGAHFVSDGCVEPGPSVVSMSTVCEGGVPSLSNNLVLDLYLYSDLYMCKPRVHTRTNLTDQSTLNAVASLQVRYFFEALWDEPGCAWWVNCGVSTFGPAGYVPCALVGVATSHQLTSLTLGAGTQGTEHHAISTAIQ